jgi:putative membrane protein
MAKPFIALPMLAPFPLASNPHDRHVLPFGRCLALREGLRRSTNRATPMPPSVVSAVQIEALKGVTPTQAVRVILVASLAALLLLVVVIYGHGRAESAPAWVSWLAPLNATLNATSAVCLTVAYLAVKRRALATHARMMLASLASSAIFLVSYIVYHSVHGDSHFRGVGLVRPVYFFVLISHVGLSAVALPLIFTSFFYSLSGRFPQHKAISRYTFPVWLYVSVTGVVVFAMLRAYT